ncbi:MAG TPA: ribonuclease H-like domain-containing protein [Candidatus Sulfobium mesophilum]|nr:ribonuclease H-like domain-containing protein [Candidatus Sulfobium mesophilum]
MIKNTFCILDGIGEKLEKRLWRERILTWENFTGADELLGFSRERKDFLDDCLMQDAVQLGADNAVYFSRRIRRREHWRLFDFFKDSAVCLDIETNGLQPNSGGFVTVVGLYDGYDYKSLVRGENLSSESLQKELSRYKCLVTFYGSAFDVPFVLRSFSGVKFDMPHFDLCFAAKRLGMKGGLKKLEHELDIVRDESVHGLDGYDAVKLWEYAKKGSRDAMDTLIRYNREDTVNLMQIASIFYERLRQSTGIEEYLSCGVA